MIDSVRTPSSPAMPDARSADRWLTLLSGLLASGRRLRGELGKRLTDAPLSEAELWLLVACREQEACQSDIAAQLGVSAAHVSQLVEQLRQRGWLACHRSSRDRRRQCWRLTAAGESLLESIRQALAPWFRELEAAVSAPEVEALRRLLTRLEPDRSKGKKRRPAAAPTAPAPDGHTSQGRDA